MSLIELVRVDLRYGERQVLSGIHLRVESGRITTLVGPNGAGKTSIVRLVLGLLAPTRGQVVRQKGLVIGYMPQRLRIDESLPLTTRRFIGLSGASQADTGRALALTGISTLAETPVQGLSGGEFQRALLARAIVRRPGLLVLDEPAQGVDVAGQDALYGLVGELRDETGCGVLMVSHDLHLVMAESDAVICINGHVCCAGTPETVGAHPEFIALFGDAHARQGTPHLAVYTHHHDHGHALDGHVHKGGDCCQ